MFTKVDLAEWLGRHEYPYDVVLSRNQYAEVAELLERFGVVDHQRRRMWFRGTRFRMFDRVNAEQVKEIPGDFPVPIEGSP